MRLFILSISLSLGEGWGEALAQDFRGAFHIEQKDFREANDSLHIAFDITIDARAVPTCTAMIFEPEIKDDNQNLVTLPYVQVTGEARAKLNRRWFTLCSDRWLAAYKAPYLVVNVNKYTGEKLHYAFSIPYESWMDNSRLVLKQEAIGCAGEEYLYTYTLSNKVAIESRAPYQAQPLFTLTTPAEESKSRSRQGSAFLDFQSGRSVILPDFRRNPVELGKINDALNEVINNTDARITGLFIEGYASPEGKFASNERLARERATALKEYIRTRYKLPEQIFTVKSVAEDWDGLKARIESGSFSQKDRILSIIDSYDAPDTKEAKLKGLSVYSQLLRDVFPELRRVEYQIDYAVRSYSNAEAQSLVNTNPSNLSQAELYRLAESYGKESADYKRIIMEIIPRHYENDATALSNAAALLIENGEVNSAIRLLEKVRTQPQSWNNLGIAYMLQGDLEKAEELLKQASVSGSKEAAHNLEELAKIREDAAKRQK